MNRFTVALVGGWLATILATPSFGADLPRKAPRYYAPAAGFSWSGFYVGINGGYGWGTSTWGAAPITTDNLHPNGWLAGGTVGYNLQTGVWVWGVEGDFDFSTIKASGVGTGLCAGAGCETRNRWLATARGRVGYAWDRFLPYVTGGAAFGDIKMTVNNTGLSETKTQIGWTVGGGVEYAFMGAWSAKVEYLYVDLGVPSCSAATCGVATDVAFRTNIVRGGINYRF